MKKIKVTVRPLSERITREHLCNPYPDAWEKCKKYKYPELVKIEDLGNGYCRITYDGELE